MLFIERFYNNTVEIKLNLFYYLEFLYNLIIT